MGGRQWRDGATFRLFAGRGGALTACGAANFAAAPCEFARKLAARPHGSAGGWAGDGALVRLLFWVGRAGVTLGAAQTRQGTSGSLDSPFAAASSGETGCEPKNAGAAPRPSRDCAVSAYLPFPRNASQQSSRDHRGEDCVNLERQQLGAGSACWALPRPAKEPQVPWILHLLPRLRAKRGANPKTQAQPRDHRGTAPSVRTYLFPETHRSSRAATIAAKTASTLSGSSWVQAQPAGRCPDPPRNLRFLGFSICCRVFGRNAVQPKNTGAAPRPSRRRLRQP